MKRIKVGDEVIVVAGKDAARKATGKVKRINERNSTVLVEGVNMVKKAIRPTETHPGGIMDIESPLHMSNVQLISPKTKGPTKVRIEERDGKRVRVAKKCGSVLD